MNRKVNLIVVSVFIIYFIFAYFFPNFLLTLELKVFDSFSVLVRNAGYFLPKLNSSQHLDEVVIVAIDEVTIQKLKKKLPLPHYLFAQLLQKIDSGNPRLIVFNMVFSGESEDKQGDAMLAEAIEGKNNILFPYITDDAGRSLGTDRFFIKDLPSAGYANKPIDFGSTIRRVRPFEFTYDDKIRDYATELYVFSRYYDYDFDSIVVDKKRVFLHDLRPQKEDKFGKHNFSLRRDNTLWIKYQADKADFNKIPMWSVLSANFNSSAFKDKIVFIGTTAKIARDIYNTPFSLMSSVEIMANAALMFLDGKFLQEAPQWLKWILILFLCIFVVFSCYRLPMFKGLLFTTSVVSIIAVVTFWLFLNNYYLNPLKFIFICILSYVAVNFYKYTYVIVENINLRKISTTDELTGLHSFRFFQVVMEHEFQKCLRYKNSLSLLMIDIDDFKKINDSYGHQNGNIVLSKIGRILLHDMRKSDFPVRYGGEEFAILLPNSDAEGAYKCAEIVRQRIEKESFLMIKQEPVKVTVSIGVSSFPSMSMASAEEMVRLADIALYEAKRQGKNKVVAYSKGE